MGNHFKYALKILFRKKILIFWTFAFPILLGTFFQMAFSDIEKNEQLDIINIAIINNDEFLQNEVFVRSFEQLSDDKSEEQLFHTDYVNEEEAKRLLANKKIDGYVLMADHQLQVVVGRSGINETILKYVTEEILQTDKIINDIIEYRLIQEIERNPTILENIDSASSQIYQDVFTAIKDSQANILDQSSHHLSYTMIEFYTLIAMTCLYGGTLGMTSINQVLANMSSHGKRISVSPVHKGRMILGSMMASYFTQLVGLLLLFIYTVFVLHVDYGSHFALVILLTCAGAFAGLSLGTAIGTLVKSNENTKTGIIISITMLGSFLSGMMGITMKYIVDKNFPIMNQLNPAAMITDGLYALYYYETFQRYYFDVISLLVFSGLMFFVSYISLRRQSYDSI